MSQKLYQIQKEGLDLKNPQHELLLNFVLDSQNAWSEIASLNGLKRADKILCKRMLCDITSFLTLIVTFPAKTGMKAIRIKFKYLKSVMAFNVSQLSDGIRNDALKIIKKRLS